jgi:hypothetical protein
MPGRTSLARILLLSVVLSGLPLATAAMPARAKTAPGAAAATPAARAPSIPAGRVPATAVGRVPARHGSRGDAFVPGRVLVRFAAGAGERGRRAAAAAVDGTVLAGNGRTRVVRLDPGADVRAAARRLAGRGRHRGRDRGRPGASVVSYRVDSSGGGIPISYLRQALLHIAADDDIDVVNLSLGGSQWSEAEQEGIGTVLASGKAVVASAGNTGDRIPQYPAAFPGVISVGATDDGGQVAGFSSYGKVDVVAPGDCVAVAELPGFLQDRGRPGDDLEGVAFNSGTSFSAPIVSGLLALAPSRSPLVARLALEATADPDHPAGDDDAKPWAHGLVDADAFVDAHDPGAPPGLVLETSGGEGPTTASGRATPSRPTATPPTSPTPSRPTTTGSPPTRSRPASPGPPPAAAPSRP